ncbi:hypothetical protein ACFLX9_03490 [Chloroflexota bacterium]
MIDKRLDLHGEHPHAALAQGLRSPSSVNLPEKPINVLTGDIQRVVDAIAGQLLNEGDKALPQAFGCPGRLVCALLSEE